MKTISACASCSSARNPFISCMNALKVHTYMHHYQMTASHWYHKADTNSPKTRVKPTCTQTPTSWQPPRFGTNSSITERSCEGTNTTKHRIESWLPNTWTSRQQKCLRNAERNKGYAERRAPKSSIDDWSMVQYSTVQYSTVQYSTVQYSTV